MSQQKWSRRTARRSPGQSVIVVILFATIVISTPSWSSAQTMEFFPLEVGNRWTYRVSSAGVHAIMKAEIASVEKVGKTECFVERYTMDGRVFQKYYLTWQGGKLLVYRAVQDSDVVDHTPPLPYLATPLSVGNTWSWSGKMQSQSYGVSWGSVLNEVSDKVTIDVPAGTYESYMITIRGETSGIAFTAHRWFVQGVGLVKEDISSSEGVGYVAELAGYFVSGYPLHVTLDIEGVGADADSLTFDGTKYSGDVLPRGIWCDYGSTHVLSVEPTIPSTTDGIRYVFRHWADGVSDPTRTIVIREGGATYKAKYKTQYLLTVKSEHGNPKGGGWYDSGALSPPISVDPDIRMPGIMGLLGARYVFVAWETGSDLQRTSPTTSFLMDGPQTVTAVWREDYRVAYLVVIVVAGLVLLSALGLYRIARNRRVNESTASGRFRSEGPLHFEREDVEPSTLQLPSTVNPDHASLPTLLLPYLEPRASIWMDSTGFARLEEATYPSTLEYRLASLFEKLPDT